jgi:hypothetical protein
MVTEWEQGRGVRERNGRLEGRERSDIDVATGTRASGSGLGDE